MRARERREFASAEPGPASLSNLLFRDLQCERQTQMFYTI